MQLRRTLQCVLLSLFVTSSLFAEKNPATSPVRVLAPVGCDSHRFLTKAYSDLLGRPLDSAGSTYWLGAIKKGTSRTQVATQIIRSAEGSNQRVRGFYGDYLHRPPGGSELTYFSGLVQQGTSSEQVRASILGSNEYFTGRGGTNPAFVAALFQDVLGRAADPQALSFYTQQLVAGTPRTSIAQQVVTSQEARQRRISAMYSRYLHHGAPGAAMPGGEDQLLAAIIGSDEYCRQ
jgi:hypothetical protein